MTDTLHLVAADKVILGGEGSISNKLKRQQPNLFARENKPCSQHCYLTEQLGTDSTFTGEVGGFSPSCFSPGSDDSLGAVVPPLRKRKSFAFEICPPNL